MARNTKPKQLTQDTVENESATEVDQEQPEGPDSGIKMKVVLGQINHSGKVYKLGDVITLTGDDALRLISLGVTQKV